MSELWEREGELTSDTKQILLFHENDTTSNAILTSTMMVSTVESGSLKFDLCTKQIVHHVGTFINDVMQ